MSSTTDRFASTRGLSASLAVGSIGLLIFGVQPVLFAGLVAESRLRDEGVGPLVTVELLAIALGSLLGARALKRTSGRLACVAGGLLLAIANASMIPALSFVYLLLMRGVVGISEGVLVAIATAAIARSELPERVSAYYLICQALLQLVVAAALPSLTWHGSSADMTLLVLSLSGGVTMAIAYRIPVDLRPVESEQRVAPPLRTGLPSLIAAGAYLGGVTVIWSFIGLWLSAHHSAPAQEGGFIAIALGFQILGAMAAAAWSRHIRHLGNILVSSLIQAALVSALAWFGRVDLRVYVFAALYGFLWQFVQPSQVGLLVTIDPTRRAVLLLPAAQLLGCALVPLAAAPLVRLYGSDGALIVGAASFVTAALIMVLIRIRTGKLRMSRLPTEA